jgi:hypothetical protein
MELEYNDILKASLCSFKFIAFRTPAISVLEVPSSLFFTFEFYTFTDVTSEVLYLKTSQQIESGDLKFDDTQNILLNKQYFLIYKDLLRMVADSNPTIEHILERAIKQQFDVNPVATRNH